MYRSDSPSGARVSPGTGRLNENEEVVKRAPFELVRERFERDGNEISAVGSRFRAIGVREVVHRARELR